MASELGLAIRRQSATPASSTDIRRSGVEVSKLVDIDLCIGCKACEVACKEWNDLEAEDTSGFASYQSHPDLTPNTWDLMRFNEVDLDDGGLAWLIKKDSCLHCDEPGCLLACPAPGAIVQYENGIVDFNQENCIGCRYCIAGCPFDIPRFDETTNKVYKCTLCVDRVSNGLEPACVKSCPTGSIRFGTKEDMVAYGEQKVAKLVDRGFADAMLYDPEGVGGLHMMYVVPRGDMLAGYDLPEDPNVPGVFFTGMSALRKLGSASMWAGLLGVGLFFLRTGRRRPPHDADVIAGAYDRDGDGQGPHGDGRGRDGAAAVGAGGAAAGAAGGAGVGGGASAGGAADPHGYDASANPGGAPTAAGAGAAGARAASGDGRATEAVDGRGEIPRYSLFDRIVHWFVALAFIYLILSGLALGYPRMAWLYDVLGGGQTTRWLHAVIGVVATVAVGVMFVAWVRDMLFDAADRRWLSGLRDYVRDGHTGVDVGRYNAGQKGYFWYAAITALLLLITGIPLWFPGPFAAGLLQVARFSHHVLFLLTVAGFIVHVYMSTAMFPGTLQAMTSGRVSRRWAAYHHPAWFRRVDGDGDDRAAEAPARPASAAERG